MTLLTIFFILRFHDQCQSLITVYDSSCYCHVCSCMLDILVLDGNFGHSSGSQSLWGRWVRGRGGLGEVDWIFCWFFIISTTHVNITEVLLHHLTLTIYIVGDHCEFCLPGSYGDATVEPGCLPCQCNGHGMAELDLCNITTGVCFCEQGYLGEHCELCDILSTGDPRYIK